MDIGELTDVGPKELRAITRNLKRTNMAIFRCRNISTNSGALLRFGGAFGLRRLDHHLCAEENGVAELTISGRNLKAGFIPYTDRRLGWHTDGYYNIDDHRLGAVVLYCVRPASRGGENALLDPDIAYIRLRDQNPDFVAALMHPECMTIPAMTTPDNAARPERSGPVFAIRDSGALFMRYTARPRNIRWRDDPVTREALQFLSTLLASDDEAILRVRLRAGEGIISNNVLHNRTAFEDDPEKSRLVYRARYLDQIQTED